MTLNHRLVGTVLPRTPPYQVTRVKIREFADALGDRNPLHHDVQAARRAGHADLVAPPTFAIVVTREAGQALIRLPGLGLDYSRVVHGEQGFQHVQPIVAGQELTTTLEITAMRTAGRHEILTYRADVHEGDDLVCRAHATLVSRDTAPVA